jgi:hypothetical protein
MVLELRSCTSYKLHGGDHRGVGSQGADLRTHGINTRADRQNRGQDQWDLRRDDGGEDDNDLNGGDQACLHRFGAL